MSDDEGERAEKRQDRAEKLAFEAGVRRAEVDGRLEGHDSQLSSLRMSIEHQSLVTDSLRRSISDLNTKLDAVIATLETNAAVEKERVRQLRTANEQQISNREFWLGIATIVAMIAAACITVLLTQR